MIQVLGELVKDVLIVMELLISALILIVPLAQAGPMVGWERAVMGVML
jgi:hypothetical protein